MVKIPTLCSCGCGTVVWNGHRYVHGHNPEGRYQKGHKTSDEIRKRLSIIRTGKKQTKECIAKRAQALRGRRLTEDHIKKIIRAHKGKKRTEECKRRISNTLKGQHKSIETEFKKGLIPWNKGKKNNQVAWNKGKHQSEETKKKLSEYCGDKCSAWKGGISFEPYCSKFNRKLKERIRERDSRTCQLCGIKENGEKLVVHHVHYDKPNCEPDLISLCRRCNSKANFNRDYYEILFIEKLRERGIK